MNMQKIMDDPALWEEYKKAYHIAGQYRPRVQFRKDLLNADHVYFFNHRVIYYKLGNPMIEIINARTNFVHPDLKE